MNDNNVKTIQYLLCGYVYMDVCLCVNVRGCVCVCAYKLTPMVQSTHRSLHVLLLEVFELFKPKTIVQYLQWNV